MIKKFENFKSDDLLEILIKIEEIEKKTKSRINIINEDPIIFEYSIISHYEKVKINITGDKRISIDVSGDNIELEWLSVKDNNYPHYTPEKLLFNDKTKLFKFLEDRYLKNKWFMTKKEPKRYTSDETKIINTNHGTTKWEIKYRIKGRNGTITQILDSPYDNEDDFIIWWGSKGFKGTGKDKELISCQKIK